MTKSELFIDVKDGTKNWECIGNSDIPVFYLYYYYPKSYEDPEEYQEWAREFIWDFKDGENTSEAITQVVKVLKHFFLSETLSAMTFVCIPASTEKKNQLRYEDFSYEVSQTCDMWDGYDHIKLKYDRDARHNGGDEDYDNLSFDREWFKGKVVILFDDIITRGNSIKNMKNKLQKMGAKVIGAIILGRTVHHDRGEDPYDKMSKSVKRGKSKDKSTKQASSSAEESARLYNSNHSVATIARMRGLAESTIYGHLFSTGTLDPHDFISENDYERAIDIYEDDNEQPSAMLDVFLDVAGKAAFYFIRRNS